MGHVTHSQLPELISRIEHWDRRIKTLEAPLRHARSLQELAGHNSSARETTHETIRQLKMSVEQAEESREHEFKNLRAELADALGYSDPAERAEWGPFAELSGKRLCDLLDGALQLRDYRASQSGG